MFASTNIDFDGPEIDMLKMYDICCKKKIICLKKFFAITDTELLLKEC